MDTPLNYTIHDDQKRVTGHGPAVVFLHALPLDASQWDHQVAVLAGAWQCIRYAFTSPSDPSHLPPSLASFATAVREDLAKDGITHFAAIGSSMGGYVACELASQYPQQLRTLILLGSHPFPDSQEQRAARTARVAAVGRKGLDATLSSLPSSLLGSAAQQEPHVVDPLIARGRRWTPEQYGTAQLLMEERKDHTAALDALPAPVHLLIGEEDTLVPTERIQRHAARTDKWQVEILPHIGHLPNLEAPHECTAHLGSLLAEDCHD